MIINTTSLKDALIIDLKRIGDERGFFARAWCRAELADAGVEATVVQANIGYCAQRGTLRGLHYQKAPHEEQKWIRCVRGSVFDVIVDLRQDSPTYRKWLGVELSAEDRRMLYVPKGFAHGYLSLEDDCEVLYMVSEYYAPDHEAGIRWDDPAFGINWPVNEELILSEKDRNWPDFENT